MKVAPDVTLRDLPLCSALRELCETISAPYRELPVLEIIRRSRHGDAVMMMFVEDAMPLMRRRERDESAFSDAVLDDVAGDFCFEARRQVDAWREAEPDENDRLPRRPSFNSVAVAIYPGARSHANTRAIRAMTPDRLARLELSNPLDELSADTKRTKRP